MQRVASISRMMTANHHVMMESTTPSSEESSIPVHDGTPRWIRRLPTCLQMILGGCLFFPGFSILSIVFFALLGPFLLLSELWITPATRRLVRLYRQEGHVVQGQIVERSKVLKKFLFSASVVYHITVEYTVNDAIVFRKKNRVLSLQEYSNQDTVQLLVIRSKPKSAMLQTTAEEMCNQQPRWKHALAGLLLSILVPTHLMFTWTHNKTWKTLLVPSVKLGILLFVVAVVLVWWWHPVAWRNPVAKQQAFFLDSTAEQVNGEMTEQVSPAQDSLTVPFLSASVTEV